MRAATLLAPLLLLSLAPAATAAEGDLCDVEDVLCVRAEEDGLCTYARTGDLEDPRRACTAWPDAHECLPARPPQPQLCYTVTTHPEVCVTVTYGRFLLLHECAPEGEACVGPFTSNPTYACVTRTPEGVCVHGSYGYLPYRVCVPQE